MQFMSMLNGGELNGFDLMILDSDEKRQKLEKAFEKIIKAGFDINEYQYEVYQQLGFGLESLNSVDVNLLKRNVERMVRQYYG